MDSFVLTLKWLKKGSVCADEAQAAVQHEQRELHRVEHRFAQTRVLVEFRQILVIVSAVSSHPLPDPVYFSSARSPYAALHRELSGWTAPNVEPDRKSPAAQAACSRQGHLWPSPTYLPPVGCQPCLPLGWFLPSDPAGCWFAMSLIPEAQRGPASVLPSASCSRVAIERSLKHGPTHANLCHPPGGRRRRAGPDAGLADAWRGSAGRRLFSYVDLEARVPGDHPLRPIRAIVDEALRFAFHQLKRRAAPRRRPHWHEYEADLGRAEQSF
jgi:hypothetical protein